MTRRTKDNDVSATPARPEIPCGCCGGSQRRTVLAGIAAGVAGWQALRWIPVQAQEAEDDDPRNLPPQPGDRFTYFYGDKEGEIVKVEDVPFGKDQVLVYPIDPKTGVVRDGSRFSMLLLIRFEPDTLDEKTKANSADGVVAYTAICTHEGCPVSMWNAEKNTLFCSCHASEYDPTTGATVMAGPAPRPLPMLPVTVENGEVVVSGEFTDRVGSQLG
tara:strand:- start:140 stop:790 length:651 start_codon:yes stop_codon:yes gene_type:complete